jgi:hypothetical protein
MAFEIYLKYYVLEEGIFLAFDQYQEQFSDSSGTKNQEKLP